MRIECHVHGNIPLRHGVTPAQVEAALRPWLEYIDEDSLADVHSVYEDEPGHRVRSARAAARALLDGRRRPHLPRDDRERR